ncbi:preprotein translocase subunit SecG [Acetanaerobacterium elongatum]|uniref:Protein-export membrane protein SecG n=1 Tax=Acetanaerobacterium elongatum TaxID=258515 RepID=A0A1H0BRX5_9FIRM|nr:preprotein translocase subunit SecG [Acetanaerobacterium elongatum]SDN48429.1 preprotein translocase subunit SecG [Acetanaerobacterium elongatum]
MSGIEIAGAIVLIIASVLLTIIIVLQDNKSGGMNAVMGGSSDSYYGKNKGRTLDAILSRWTKIIAIAFFVVIVAVNVALVIIK